MNSRTCVLYPQASRACAQEGVRGQAGKLFVQDTVLLQRFQLGRLDLSGQFVLAAGDGEDDGRLRGDCLGEGVIRGRVARVKRHGEVDRAVDCLGGDFADVELETAAIQLLA